MRWHIEWLDETGHSCTTEIDAAHWQGACDDLLDQHPNAEIVSVTDEDGEKVEI
ncbi:hypothetical protein [Thalassobius sp. Cn5-15]|uniref:hypothetical protein n=1 Tax=Thalassobius sp. Cn5-15 TaxID=2917763 RepID=UPI001EF25BAC|nr:hypothetical protein [Thalassobius sp. Cn5-15]MCG7492436.1 hypothetical protein [Thalassobius sp. Cn5-15]